METQLASSSQGQSTSTSTQLRPYSAALSQSWGILKAKFWKLFAIELFSYIPALGLVIIFLAYGFAQFGLLLGKQDQNLENFGAFSGVAMIVLGAISLIILIALIIFLFWGQAAKLLYLKHSDSGMTARQAIKLGWGYWRSYAWASILYGLKMLLGVILLVVPGIIWYVKYLFTPYAAVFEREQGARGGRALDRASKLISGYRWGIFARILATGLLLGVVQFGIQMLLGLIQAGFTLTGSKALVAVVMGVFWIIAAIIGVGLKLYRTIYEYVLYEETSFIKSENENATHYFSGGKKALIIVLIILATLIPIGILTALSFTALDQAKTKAGDAKTISTAYQIQTALELHRGNQGSYPAGENLNLEQTYCLDYDLGFISSACTGDNAFRVPVPTNENDTFYYTQTNNGQDYELTFSLESSSGGFGAGKQTATSRGIQSANPVTPSSVDGFKIQDRPDGKDSNSQDQDNDGLSDFDEIMTWNTNPANPDTDGDGYKDGEEVKNGYRPDGPGKIIPETPSEQFVSVTSDQQSIGDCVLDQQLMNNFQSSNKGPNANRHTQFAYRCPNGSTVVVLISDAGSKENVAKLVREVETNYPYAQFKPYSKNSFVSLSVQEGTYVWSSGNNFITLQYTVGTVGNTIDQASLERIVDEYIKTYPPEGI